MTIDGGLNIGRARARVVFLTKSPFSGQQKQEVSSLFTQDTFRTMVDVEGVTSVPSPINGFRLEEKLETFDNFMVDIDDVPLEEAVLESSTTGAPASAVSKQRFDEIARLGEIPEDQKTFFTWKMDENLFLDSEQNPIPNPVSGPKVKDNAPEWVYQLYSRPSNRKKAEILTPYMKKNFENTKLPVHWGCTMLGTMAENQPFEITFNYDPRVPNVATEADALIPRFKFVQLDGTPLDPESEDEDIGLTNSVYLAIETGIGNPKNHFLFLFKNDTEPFFFQLRGSGENQEAVLLARFTGFNARKLFDANHRFFTISIEPVIGSFIVRSNVFSDTPWIILAPINRPFKIGEGKVGIYSGNVTAGFSMRPMQYLPKGTFKTPEMTFNFVEATGGEDNEPTCTTALKGSGDSEQDRSKNSQGDPELHAVDAEKVNGQSVRTVGTVSQEESSRQSSVQREIDVSLEEVDVRDSAEVGDFDISTKVYQNLIELKAGNVQNGGFTVENGRSPYIFLVRCEVPAIEGEDETEAVDISCDVQNIELSWNATSYNELQHTGSITVLNIRNVSGTDYRQYTNRAVYVRIFAKWENGAGDSTERPIFTGLTVGPTVDTRAEKETITFRIEDYMSALQGSKFVLSPFYDGMKASLAVRDMVLQTGFPDDRILTNNTPISDANLADDLGLPLANPFEGNSNFRLKDGTSIKEGILKIARLQFRVVYFDGEGNFHYEEIPGGDIFVNKNFEVKSNFWSSRTGNLGGGGPADQAWNSVSFSRAINDVANVIQVETVDKRDLQRLSVGTAYKSGIFDPGAEGYLGYRKHFLIKEAAIGSLDGLLNILDVYRRRFTIPPLTARWEAYGRSGLKPLDIVTLDGQEIRIMNIQTRLNAQENTYYQTYEGEWAFAAGSSKDQDPGLSQPNTGPTTSPGNNAGTRSTH